MVLLYCPRDKANILFCSRIVFLCKFCSRNYRIFECWIIL